MKSFLALTLVLVLCVSLSYSFTTGINSVVSFLADYQAPGGGFRAYRDAEATLESTSQALFLSSLFGLRDKIKSNEASAFVQSLANLDHGFGNKLGQPSDIESVRNALLSFTHLGIPISNSPGVATFIQSLYDRDTKLFASTVGGSGDLKATALALQSLSILNQLQTKDVTEKFEGINKYLESSKKSKDGVQFFSSITSDNYYAVLVGSYTDFTFGNIKEWARYFQQRQVLYGSLAGGFFTDSEFQDATIEDAAFAINALHVLSELSDTDFLSTINTQLLLDYTQGLPRNLALAANAYIAISRTSALQTLFKISPTYDVLDSRFRLVGNRIVQGTQVKPAIAVRTSYGLAHAGLDASATITWSATGEKVTKKLTWNSDAQVYSTDEFYDTLDKLGEVSFDFVLRWRVADLGAEDLVLSLKDSKTVGYDLSVSAKAVHAGKEVDPNSEIGFGSEFNFNVRLGTTKQPKPSLLSGDFDVIFSVKDSSDVVIHKSKFDARNNKAPISFKYTLNADNIPAGDVTFSFSISNARGVHTISSVGYRLPVHMVATQITFKGFADKEPTYKIGDKVSVEFTPANLPDLKTLRFYSSKDASDVPVTRKFYMAVSSAETGRILFSLLGENQIKDDKPSYVFNVPVEASFSSIGSNVVSFHYQGASGEVFPLLNHDSKRGEIYDETTRLIYTVQAELHVTDLKSGLKDGELVYGNEVKFSFKVKDAITKKNVFALGEDGNTVSLVLRHVNPETGATFTSNVQRAVQVTKDGDADSPPDHFEITWSVNPNAVNGKGFIQLVAQGNDGKEIALLDEKAKETYRVNVEIGGEISVDHETYSNSVDEEESVFFVEAILSCAGKELNGAHLQAAVTRVGADGKPVRVATLPVSFAGRQGMYQVSWTLKSDQAVSGEYTVNFYRDVDLEGKSTDAESKVSPLFTVPFSHTQRAVNVLPFKTEFLVLSLLVVSFFWTSFKKMDIEGLRKAGKKNK